MDLQSFIVNGVTLHDRLYSHDLYHKTAFPWLHWLHLHGSPSFGPGRVSCALLHTWIGIDHIIRMGRRVVSANQSTSYQNLPEGYVFFCEAMTTIHTKHAFVVDTRVPGSHVILDGTCRESVQYRHGLAGGHN